MEKRNDNSALAGIFTDPGEMTEIERGAVLLLTLQEAYKTLERANHWKTPNYVVIFRKDDEVMWAPVKDRDAALDMAEAEGGYAFEQRYDYTHIERTRGA